MKNMVTFSFLTLLFLTACYAPGSFKVSKPGLSGNRVLYTLQLTRNNPYMILHEGDSAWNLSDYQLNNNNSGIVGKLNPLPPERMSFKTVNPKATNKAPVSNPYPFDEIHLKVVNLVPDSARRVVLRSENIHEVQLYNLISNKRTAAQVGGSASLGVAATILIIAGVVSLLVGLILLVMKEMLNSLFGD